MARGYDEYRARLDELNAFARQLVRRSGSKCELCGTAGEKLTVYEVPPIPDEPKLEQVIFICNACKTGLESPQKRDANDWKCLYDSVWSDVPAVQVIALHTLKQLTSEHMWAEDLLDQVYLSPEVSDWLDEIK